MGASDVQAALDFYIQGLGFHLSDVIDWKLNPEMSARLYFLHCNGRHHTLALAALPVGKKLHHSRWRPRRWTTWASPTTGAWKTTRWS